MTSPRLTVLGGGREVGANSFLLTVDGVRLLLDAGAHPRHDGAASLPRFDLAPDADAILIGRGTEAADVLFERLTKATASLRTDLASLLLTVPEAFRSEVQGLIVELLDDVESALELASIIDPVRRAHLIAGLAREHLDEIWYFVLRWPSRQFPLLAELSERVSHLTAGPGADRVRGQAERLRRFWRSRHLHGT